MLRGAANGLSGCGEGDACATDAPEASCWFRRGPGEVWSRRMPTKTARTVERGGLRGEPGFPVWKIELHDELFIVR